MKNDKQSRETAKPKIKTCPVCGTVCTVEGDDKEGTHYYKPAVASEEIDFLKREYDRLLKTAVERDEKLKAEIEQLKKALSDCKKRAGGESSTTFGDMLKAALKTDAPNMSVESFYVDWAICSAIVAFFTHLKGADELSLKEKEQIREIAKKRTAAAGEKIEEFFKWTEKQGGGVN